MVLVAVTLSVAFGCSSDDGGKSEAQDTTSTSASDTTTSTEETPTSLTVSSVEPDANAGPTDPNATGTFMMMKLSVGDLDEAEAFYGNVFGATVGMKIGDGAHLIGFPDGGPGLILIENDEADDGNDGAFIIQVPDLEASQALAVANGATVEKAFEGQPGDQPARSVDLRDPWNNQVEILQLG
jgi:predicted enzyme related to lactoylglutathione lyase